MSSEPTSVTERVTALMLLLMNSARFRTRREICQETSLYGDNWDNESIRKKFQRDLDVIRETGVRIEQKTAEDTSSLYRINPQDTTLTLSNPLTQEELIALSLAARKINLSQDWDVIAVNKLVAATNASYETTPVGEVLSWQVDMPISDHFPELAKAVADRCEVTCTYNGKKRVVKPLELLTQSGWRYLAVIEDGQTKSFRVDRFEGEIKLGPPASFEPPGPVDWTALLPADATQMQIDDELICVLAVDSQQAALVEQTRGKVIKRHADGSIELEVAISNRSALLGWLYELGHHAKILSPPEMVDELKSSLAHLTKPLSAPPTGESGTASSPAASQPSSSPAASKASSSSAASKATQGKPSKKSGPPKRTFADEIALLAAIVPWAYQRNSATATTTTVADVMETFGLSQDVALSLLRSASVFEVPDKSGFAELGYVLLAEDPADDDVIEQLDPSQVIMAFDKSVLLNKPFNLTMQEAAGLVLVGNAAMSVPGSDPHGALASGLAKVRAEFGNKLKLSANPEQPMWMDELTAAIGKRRRLQLRYDSYSQGEMVDQAVNPLKMLNHTGHWYLLASPPHAQQINLYRLSRIDELQETGETFEHNYADEDLTFESAAQDTDTQLVVLSIAPQDWRTVERYPSKSLEEIDGRIVAQYDLRSPLILARMLMLLGPDSQVVNVAELPDNYRTAGLDAANKILARYES